MVRLVQRQVNVLVGPVSTTNVVWPKMERTAQVKASVWVDSVPVMASVSLRKQMARAVRRQSSALLAIATLKLRHAVPMHLEARVAQTVTALVVCAHPQARVAALANPTAQPVSTIRNVRLAIAMLARNAGRHYKTRRPAVVRVIVSVASVVPRVCAGKVM